MKKYSEICYEIIETINKYNIPKKDKIIILNASIHELKNNNKEN